VRFDEPPVVRVTAAPGGLAPGSWPLTVPAVEQLVREGLRLRPGVTFLVGENGSGKSTIVEAVAEAYGLPPDGGSTQGGRSTFRSESPLGQQLRVERGLLASRWGFFLRAEAMHGWYTFSEESAADMSDDDPRRPPRFHEMSHGESFLAVARARLDSGGFYCLDEPEAALSFSSTLTLLGHLADLVEQKAQVLCATHSPVLASLPGARILEVGDWGLRETTWEELDLVQHWRRFMDAPGRYLRHVVGD
jgi:predicted ATPase